jgi:putative ABC transport system permease protein
VLLIAAGMMLRGYRDLRSAFVGLRPDRVLTFVFNLPERYYPENRDLVEFHDRLLSGISGLPGVERAALIRNAPASNVPSPSALFTIDGRASLSVSDMPRADVQNLTPAAFEALGVPMVAGRGFRDGDRAGAPRVAIISGAMARRYWPGGDPLGASIRLADASTAPITVVGVADDFKLNWYDPQPRTVVYLPAAQAPARRMRAVVRAGGDPLRLARPIATVARGIDDRQALSGLKTLQAEVDEALAPVRIVGLLLSVCAVVAIAIAGAGIYGVLAHWVASRSRELGVRLALGARPGDLMRLVLVEAIRMTIVGLSVAVPLALAAAWVGRRSLFGLPSPTISVVGGVCVLAIAIVAVAAAGPAFGALRADPRRLLQSE